MRDTDADVFDVQPGGKLFDFSIKVDSRLTAAVVYYLYIRPGNLASPARPHKFQDRLLRSKPPSQLLDSVSVRPGVCLLARRKNPVKKAPAVPLYHFFYTRAIYKVYAVCHNFHLLIQINDLIS
jgi:hypothetical protein